VLGCVGGVPTASSYLQTENVSAWAVAEMAAICTVSKYQELAAQYTVQPVALESLSSVDSDIRDFLVDLGQNSPESPLMTERFLFLFQRISVLLFRFNSVLLFDSFELDDRLEL